MNKITLFLLMSVTLILSTVFVSCDPDPDPVTGEAIFTYEADGLEVAFTNTSTVSGTSTYDWDFGDGESSSDENPTHTYAAKGEYTVKLILTDEQAGTHDISTKINIDRKSRISVTDNTLSDWDVVTEDQFVVTLGDNTGVISGLKFEYDADYVYALLTYEGTQTDSTILNVFVDSDNDLTGFKSSLWELLGVDYLLQGQVELNENSWFGSFNYIGEDHGWGWESEELAAGFYVMGFLEENDGKVSYEIAFSRADVPGLDQDEVNIALYLANKFWAEIGYAPDKQEAGGDQKNGFVLSMN